MHSSLFIQDLTVVMLIAGAVTILFRRLCQPVILGYILAGVIIGPYSPPFSLIHNQEIIHTLAELGVILLLFSLGLHFNLQKLGRVGLAAFIAAFFEILFMVWIGDEIGNYLGWNDLNSLFLGGILAISSTTIIVKAFEELGLIEEKFSELVFGVLIVEDILAMALIALLSSIALTGSLQVREIFQTLGRLGIFLTLLLVLGLLLVPPLLRWIDRFKSKETMLVSVLALCFGVSLIAIQLGYSEALGAFIIGAIIAEVKGITKVESLILPIRDMFSAIFFVSVGMMINPVHLQAHWPLILLLCGVVIIGKVLTCSFGTLIAGYDLKTSFRVGMSLAQIGEFSFIIATLGLSLKVTNEALYPIAVMLSAITTFTTPYLIRYSDRIAEVFLRLSPARLVKLLRLYTIWLQKAFHQGSQDESRAEIKRALLQLAINLVLVAGIFIVANYAADRLGFYWPNRPSWLYDLNPLLWGLGMLVSLPLLTVSFSKFKKVGDHFTKRVFSLQTVSIEKLDLLRVIFSNIFLFAGILGVGLWILILSAAMFNNFSVLIFLVMLVLSLGFVFRRLFIKIYSKAHSALLDTLSDPLTTSKEKRGQTKGSPP